MALGLSLMQNRAGKGFNLSNILGEVGRAGGTSGEAAKEARAGQMAAGKFALQNAKLIQLKNCICKERRLALMQLVKARDINTVSFTRT